MAVEGTDITHLANHRTLLNTVIYLLVRWLGKPCVVCTAGALPIHGRSKRLCNRLIGCKIIRNANGHTPITAGEVSQFTVYGIDPERISVIPHGVDSEDYPVVGETDPREEHRLKEHPFVLFVGRLNHIEGPDLLSRTEKSYRSTTWSWPVPTRGGFLACPSMDTEAGIRCRVTMSDTLEAWAKLRSTCASSWGEDFEVAHGSPRLGDVRHCSADVAPLRGVLGISPNADASENLKRYYTWMVSDPISVEKVLSAKAAQA